MILQAPRAHLSIAATTVGHDIDASSPGAIQTSTVETPDGQTIVGPTEVKHDFLVTGSPGPIFAHDLCDLHVGHDFMVTGTQLNFGMTIGDTDSDGGCSTDAADGRSNTIGHDLVVADNAALSNPFFGPSGIDVGNNKVGHDLIVNGNTATGNLRGLRQRRWARRPLLGEQPAPSADDPVNRPNVAGRLEHLRVIRKREGKLLRLPS